MSAQHVCVIGAGPAGLTALQVLSERGVRVSCFEQGPAVGGQWRRRNESGTSSAYASLEMMSSRIRTGFRRFRLRAPAHRYPLLREIQDYLEDFARTYDLFDHIAFEEAVTAVEPAPGGWQVSTQAGERGVFDAVVVATGHHSLPLPLRAPANFTGTVSHSADYFEPTPFCDQRVLIVGFGNSALDIASEVAGVAAATAVSARNTGHLLPKRLGGVPLDWLDTNLASLIPFKLRQRSLATILRIAGRDGKAYGVPPADHGLLRRIPVTVTRFGDQLLAGAIELKQPIVGASGRSVRFADGSTGEFDHIVYATGFAIAFPFLSDDPIPAGLDPLYRRILSPRLPGIYFAGLIDPNGGLLMVLEAQCEWIADAILGCMTLPDEAGMLAASPRERQAIEERFVTPTGPATWLLCDRYPYMRQLRRDRRAKHAAAARN
jgi:dimethylaniline monooxygenase (N-oxide forming)